MRRQCRGRFPLRWLQRNPVVSDHGMHNGTCETHVTWCMSASITRSGRLNVHGIPGACANQNFTYLVMGPWDVVTLAFGCCLDVGVFISLMNWRAAIFHPVYLIRIYSTEVHYLSKPGPLCLGAASSGFIWGIRNIFTYHQFSINTDNHLKMCIPIVFFHQASTRPNFYQCYY